MTTQPNIHLAAQEELEHRANGTEVASGRGCPLTLDDKLLIVWGMWRGLTAPHLARRMKRHPHTVQRYRRRVVMDPGVVFDDQLPLFHRQSGEGFICRFCGETRAGRMRVMRHVLAHFLPYEMARGARLGRVERPL